MKYLFKIIGLCIVSAFGVFAQSTPTFWQTTHTINWHSSGDCRIMASSMKINVNAMSVDVEEEAIIETIGSVSNGDPATLEIVGEFSLPAGSAVRSMLLWNGNTILKAKLLDKLAADSAYENVVDRDKAKVIPRDPAIIKYIGNNLYQFKIYPVAIGQTRKLRILYTTPLVANATTCSFSIQSAFAPGTIQSEYSVPVKVVKKDAPFNRYFISYGSITKTLQFDANYSISSNAFASPYTYGFYSTLRQQWVNYKLPLALSITPDTSNFQIAYTSKNADGASAGYYTALCTSMPVEFVKSVNNLDVSKNFNFDVITFAGDQSYFQAVGRNSPITIYMKSVKAWNHKVVWTAYEKGGKIATSFEQIITPDSISQCVTTLPLLWASQYSLREQKGSLGAVFGFVDKQMTLLALERDTLPSALSAQYRLSGVPLLLPEEIIVSKDKMPEVPIDNVIYIIPPITLVKNDLVALSNRLQVSVLPNGLITISLSANSTSLISLELYDVSGRLVFSQKNLSATAGKLSFNIPKNINGMHVLKVFSGKEHFVQKVSLR